jgi:hypothetical protein
MGDVVRRVMQFLIPTSIDALGRDDLVDRTIVPVYINPQSFSIQESKIINENLTKGGYVIQYWGEELPIIQASGTTGSGGIEAVNILRDVYRHEQTQFKALLDGRSADLASEAQAALNNTSNATASAGLTNILDTITDGGFSGIVDGISSSIEAITNAAQGIVESNPNRVQLIPSIAAFAISIDLWWQGEKFRGYFTSFSVDENASTPGHFDYQFTFKVIKRSGVRTNFMPWHRSPTDAAGQPITASTPKEGARTDELSFSTTLQEEIVASQFINDQAAPVEAANVTDVNVSINRNSILTG